MKTMILISFLILISSLASANETLQDSNTLSEAEINLLLKKAENPVFFQCAEKYEMDGIIQSLFDNDSSSEESKSQEQIEDEKRAASQIKSYLRTGKLNVRQGVKASSIPKNLRDRCTILADFAMERIAIQVLLVKTIAPKIGEAMGKAMGEMMSTVIQEIGKSITMDTNPQAVEPIQKEKK